MKTSLRFPRLSLGLAILLALAASVYAGYLYGLGLAILVLLALTAPTPSALLRAVIYDSDFTLPALLDLALEEFVNTLLPLRAFSLGVTNGKLLSQVGKKEILVPFVPADASDVRDFSAANGDCYETGDVESEKRSVTINKRKYVSWGQNSEDENVTPAIVKSIDWARLKGQRLAEVILADILSIVTAGNFPLAKNIGAAGSFDTDDVFDIRLEMNNQKMPKTGRQLILDDDYDSALLKDNKDVAETGTVDPRWNANIPKIAGFQEYGTQVMPTAGNLVGIANFPSAILVAIAPVEPMPSVKKKLVDFRVIVHEETGITLVYKKIADEVCDTEMEILETSYGTGVGNEGALLRLTSA